MGVGQKADIHPDHLSALVTRALDRDPARPAIEYEGRWYSWGELRALADAVHACLTDSGAGAGHPIAFIPRNRPWAIAALLGMIADARTIQMVYAFQAPAAIVRNLETLCPAVVVAAREEFTPELVAMLRRDGIAAVVLDGMGASLLHGLESTRASDDLAERPSPEIQILTSGTTGPPKQYPFPYELFARHHILPALAGGGFDVYRSEEPPFLLSFPLSNITGMYSTLPTLISGQRGVLVDRFSIDAWHDWVKRFRPKNGGLPPAGVQMVLDRDIPREDLASIEFVGTGAAPLDPTVQRAFEKRYGIPILLSYGATEFGGPVTTMTPQLHAEWGDRKFGSVGRALPGVRLRVIDPDRGAELSCGEEGLLEVVAPRIGQHWIRTADVVTIDSDGFLFHRGRADGAVMRGGFKLIPEAIERALLLHPAVAAAAVVGRKDRRLGEVPVAAVQLKPGAIWPGDAALAAHVREYVPATHVPAAWLKVEEVPLNRSSKIDRPSVRALFADS